MEHEDKFLFDPQTWKIINLHDNKKTVIYLNTLFSSRELAFALSFVLAILIFSLLVPYWLVVAHCIALKLLYLACSLPFA
jgi:hypothetical protein